MSNSRRPSTPSPDYSALRCDDCASEVRQVWYGRAPDLTLSIELEHSPTCPAPTGELAENGNEILLQLLPKSRSVDPAFVRGEQP